MVRATVEATVKKVKIGKYKIAYLYPHEQDVLGSEMFDSLPEARLAAAEAESSGTPYLLMRLTVQGDGEYYWRVLPYGAHRPLSLARTLYNLRLPLLVGAGIAALLGAARLVSKRRRRSIEAGAEAGEVTAETPAE